MRRFVIQLSFDHQGIDFCFPQDVRPIVADHRTVTDITENPYDPILGRKFKLEPSAVQTDDFPIHGAVEFDVRYTVYVLDSTKSSRTGVRVDVPPTLVMSDIFPFIQRPIDYAQALTQSAQNVDVNVRTVWGGIRPVDDETVLRGEDERLEPFLGVTLVPPSCSLQCTVVLDRLQHSFLYSFLAGKHPMSHERHPILHGSNIGVGIGIRDIFDPHVGRHRSVVEFVCRFDVRDSAIDFGDDRPSRKIRQKVVFVMITNGKRQGHEGHFPILFFQDESIG